MKTQDLVKVQNLEGMDRRKEKKNIKKGKESPKMSNVKIYKV